MTYLNASQVTGNELTLARTDPRHLAGRLDPTPADPQAGTFSSLLMKGLNSVNDSLETADTLAVKAVTDPESVNAHDVSIAAAKASLSLGIAKSVVDRVITAYREIQNLR